MTDKANGPVPVEPKEFPHVPAAYINAIAEEGDKREAIEFLQKTWNELCAIRQYTNDLQSALKVAQEERDAEREERRSRFSLDDLNIDVPCETCGGLGRRLYGSTSTWWYGIGGQAMTTDVCDTCWGSGDKNKTWPSHKKAYQATKRAEQAESRNKRLVEGLKYITTKCASRSEAELVADELLREVGNGR